MTLGWVIAYVDDPAAAAAFYERTFGLRTDFVVPGEYAQMDTGPTKLGFATYALARGNFDGGVRPAGSDGPPPNVEIALVAEDVDAAYRIAVGAGCEPLAAPADKAAGAARRLRARPVRDAGRARHAALNAARERQARLDAAVDLRPALLADTRQLVGQRVRR